MARLYGPDGHWISEWHPGFEARKRSIEFGTGGYNPVPERRGFSGGIWGNAGSETWFKNRDRLRQIWDSRDACTFDWVGGMLARVTRYVVGRLHCKSNTGDEQLDEVYDNYLHDWSGDERDESGLTKCDITGRHRFLKLVQMAFLAHMVDGDFGFIEVAPQFSPTAEYDAYGNWIPGTGSFCLQSVEADRIGSPLEATTDETYIGGIKFDPATGRIAFYRVFQRTRTQQYVKPREILPQDFLHVFDPDKTDEYRGRPKLVRCLNDLRDIREWIEAEKMAGKTQAQWAAMVGLKDPFNNTGPMAWSGKTGGGTPTQDAQWGKILRMSEGEQFSMLTPSARPSGAFLAFIQILIRKLSISLELSYGLVWDLATLGGVSQRIEVQSDLRKIQSWQENLIKGQILDRVRSKVLAFGVANQEIPAHPNMKKCSWNFGPYITADLGYEMEADISSLSHGIVEIDQIVSKHTGKSASEVFRANANVGNEAIGIATETGQPVEVFAKGLFPDITIQRAAFVQSQLPPAPPPPPLSPEVVGEKGIKDVLDLQIAVGDGKIDRDAAIQTLIYKYKVPRQIAEKVIPEEPSEPDLNRAAGLDAKGNHAPVASSSPSKNGSHGSNGSGGRVVSSSKPKTNGAKR